jgi:hypothetical protein
MFQMMDQVRGKDWDILPQGEQQQVIASMQTIVDFYVPHNANTPSPQIVIQQLKKEYGHYDSTTNCLYINKDWVTDNVAWNQKIEAHCQVLNTIIHEGRHAEQHTRISQAGNRALMPEEQKWRDNDLIYFNVGEKRQYRFQPQEADAFKTAGIEVGKIFTQLQNNDYSTYAAEYSGYVQYTIRCNDSTNAYLQVGQGKPVDEKRVADAMQKTEKQMAELLVERDHRIAAIQNVDVKKVSDLNDAVKSYLYYAKNLTKIKNYDWKTTGDSKKIDIEVVNIMLVDKRYTNDDIVRALETASPRFIPSPEIKSHAKDFVEEIAKQINLTATNVPRYDQSNIPFQPGQSAANNTTQVTVGEVRTEVKTIN